MTTRQVLVDRLANQMQRAELAKRAGQTTIAAKFERLVEETKGELAAIGHADAAGTAAHLGLAPGRVPPQ